MNFVVPLFLSFNIAAAKKLWKLKGQLERSYKKSANCLCSLKKLPLLQRLIKKFFCYFLGSLVMATILFIIKWREVGRCKKKENYWSGQLIPVMEKHRNLMICLKIWLKIASRIFKKKNSLNIKAIQCEVIGIISQESTAE